MGEIDLSKVEVLPNLPHYFRPPDGDPLPDDLVGATVVRFGAVADPRRFHGGGLVIDYRKPGDDAVWRIILQHDGTVMWEAGPPCRMPPSNPG